MNLQIMNYLSIQINNMKTINDFVLGDFEIDTSYKEWR